MELDTKCVLCNRLDEDGGQLFFKCKYVLRVWRALNMETCRQRLAEKQSAREVMLLILSLKEEDVIILWHWWQERNRVRGDRRREADDLVYIVQKQASELIHVGSEERVQRSCMGNDGVGQALDS